MPKFLQYGVGKLTDKKQMMQKKKSNPFLALSLTALVAHRNLEAIPVPNQNQFGRSIR